jgi:hypothetical protein
MRGVFAAVYESGNGPKLTWRRAERMSASELIVLQKSPAPRPVAKNGQY